MNDQQFQTMNRKRGWSFIGLFIIALVVSLPFYSANALAVSVQITKNQGQAAIPKFIDAQGDVWTVEATITGAPQAVEPTNVKIKIGSNEAPFQSCSSTALGTACEYISPLTDGVVEGEHTFQAVYTFLNPLGLPESVSNSDVIKADGSGPTIEFKKLQQNAQGQVEINFKVTDKKTGAPAVGIKTIEMVEADSGNVLQTIAVPAPGTEQYNYDPDAGTNGILPAAALSGEGLKRIKLRAEDWLGHSSSQNPVKDFQSDFVAPLIKDNLNFTKIGKFIGNSNVVTGMTVDLVETNLKEVKASSSEAGLDNTPATGCLEDLEQEHLWHCAWNEVEVQPTESISVSILATDNFGNSASKTISRSLTKDSSAPQIDFFGSERQFDDQNFIRDGKQQLVLRVKEQGAGITEEGIRANLLALGKGTSAAPDRCEQAESSFNCIWETTATGLSGVARIGLSKFEDRVGNQGETPEIELQVDNAGPLVEKLEIFGVSEIGDKGYFQSNDQVKIKFTVVESNGLMALVNVNEVVMDAEHTFPETSSTADLSPTTGWQVFTEESCSRSESGKWLCEIVTAPMKSGPDANVEVLLRVQDTAGNDARWPEEAKNVQLHSQQGAARLTFDLLGLSEENEPDFWEVSTITALTEFIDLDTTELTYTRLPFQVKLKSDEPSAKVLAMEVEGCESAGEGAAPEVSRTLLLGGKFPEGSSSPQAMLFVEFAPFNGRELFAISDQGTFDRAVVEYTCRLKVFSLLGKNALRAAEVQEVPVEVGFSFSRLGAIDENLAIKVRDLKETGLMKFLNAMSKLNTAFEWLNYATNFLQIASSALQLFGLFSGGLIAAATKTEKGVVTAGFGTVLRGGCASVDLGTGGLSKTVRWLEVPTQILNCNPGAFGTGETDKAGKPVGGPIDVAGSSFGFYAWWQRSILELYNVASGRDILGVPASSLYENVYASFLGLCLPGIAYNLNKAREIQCRRILCYGREVPQGIATAESCERLFDLQMCEYFWGPAFDFFLMGGIGAIGRMLQAAFTSPLGLISLAEVLACANFCYNPVDETGFIYYSCKTIKIINTVLSIINSIVQSIDTRPSVTGSPYCKMAEGIDPDQLVGAAPPAAEGPPAEAEPAPAG